MTSELLRAMAAQFPEDEWRVLLPRGGGVAPPGTLAHRTRLSSRALFGAAALTGRPRLDAILGGVDVVWLPAPVPVAISPQVPYVLTVHDISWIERPRDFGPYERLWHLLARLRSQAHGAARIAAVSEHTRGVATRRWGLDPGRISVVAPPILAGVDPVRERASATPREPYFLWVGALEPRKAPDVLADAWAVARARGLAAELLVVGEGRVALEGPGVQHRGRVSDAELSALYEGALALVMPSRLEGFGLPPLEAALHRTPSICSELPALRESLGGPAAEWVPVDDSRALADALLRIAVEPERRHRIADAARSAALRHADPAPSAARMRALLAEAAAT